MKSLVFVGSLALAGGAFGADSILVLSGGGNPASNHYSQYLQTKTLTEGLRTLRPEGVDVRFGAGNSDSQPKLAADVHRMRTINGHETSDILFGVIPGNRPATASEVDTYFGGLTSMQPNDTFYLFVSDHGMPNPNARRYENNCINLWDYDAATGRPGSAASCFSKDDLKGYLEKVPARRKVFVMSQCYSGGFHALSVEEKDGYPTADANICGFTAVTDDTIASGCTPDVDGPGYKGYERYFTQALTGVDIVTGQRLAPAQRSLVAAHTAAALLDPTKDIPLRTSEYYLLRWSIAMNDSAFRPRTGVLSPNDVRTRFDALMGSRLPEESALALGEELKVVWRQKADYLSKTLALFGEDATLRPLLSDTSEIALSNGLRTARGQMQEFLGKLQQTAAFAGQARSLLYSAWSEAIRNGEIRMSETEKNGFERFLQQTGGRRTLALLFLAYQTNHQPELAEPFSKYYATREARLAEWAKAAQDTRVRELLQKYQQWAADQQKLETAFVDWQRRYDNLRRVLFTRREMAGLALLGEMQDEQALTELKGLLACEETRI